MTRHWWTCSSQRQGKKHQAVSLVAVMAAWMPHQVLAAISDSVAAGCEGHLEAAAVAALGVVAQAVEAQSLQ